MNQNNKQMTARPEDTAFNIQHSYHDLAKQLSYYLYLLFFSFSFGLTIQKKVWESVMSQVS